MRPVILPQNKGQRLSFVAKKIRSRALPCEIRESCQSCRFVNQKYADGLQSKFKESLVALEEKNLLSRTRILEPQAAERNFAYRTTMKLAVREEPNGQMAIGLFQPGSHKVINVSSCPLHVEGLQKLLIQLQPVLQLAHQEKAFSAWNEQECRGDLRYIVARASNLTNEVQLIFVVSNDEKKNFFRNMTRDLSRRGVQINSAFLNINDTVGNDILGRDFVLLQGQEHLRVSMNDFALSAGPGSFLQVNPWQASHIYSRIAQFAETTKNGDVAWDLCCGIGPISLSLARKGFRVWGMEENPGAIEDAKNNALRNNFSEEQITFECGRIEDHFSNVPMWATGPSLVVVNPSRRGLAPVMREQLAKLLQQPTSLRHLLYMSCEVQTLARDLEDILAKGGRLSQIEAFDMFPHTEKLEWLAVISPSNK